MHTESLKPIMLVLTGLMMIGCVAPSPFTYESRASIPRDVHLNGSVLDVLQHPSEKKVKRKYGVGIGTDAQNGESLSYVFLVPRRLVKKPGFNQSIGSRTEHISYFNVSRITAIPQKSIVSLLQALKNFREKAAKNGDSPQFLNFSVTEQQRIEQLSQNVARYHSNLEFSCGAVDANLQCVMTFHKGAVFSDEIIFSTLEELDLLDALLRLSLEKSKNLPNLL